MTPCFTSGQLIIFGFVMMMIGATFTFLVVATVMKSMTPVPEEKE